MTYALIADFIGTPPIANWGAADLVPVTTPVTPPRISPGTIVQANDPFWGGGEFIYLQMPASTAAKVGAILAYDTATAFLSSLVPNTTLLGKALAILVNPLVSSAVPQFGWAQISGYGPVWSSASVAANTAIGIVAAGQGGALAAGKQIIGMRVTAPATGTTVIKTCGVGNGSPILATPNSDGLIPGMLLSGTGIPATTFINSIGVDGKSLVMSNNATASNFTAITAAYATATDFYNLCVFNRPVAQGPIT